MNTYEIIAAFTDLKAQVEQNTADIATLKPNRKVAARTKAVAPVAPPLVPATKPVAAKVAKPGVLKRRSK